ncbi:MAG: hypothetical protein LJE68_17120 [Rhodobacter sp.]|nr:hypothetical protein [Rhodobacter sp.]
MRRRPKRRPIHVIRKPRRIIVRPDYPWWKRPTYQTVIITDPLGRRRVVRRRRDDLPADRKPAAAGAPVRSPRARDVSRRWVRSQIANAQRHLTRLTPFRRQDYGVGLARPKEANIRAANDLLKRERDKQKRRVERLAQLGRRAEATSSTPALSAFARMKDDVTRGTRSTEAIWHFYDDIFGQRRGALADQLAAMDRIALDCYQTSFMGLGRARSLPTPPPMAYSQPAVGPATYRRNVPVPRIGRQANPFPLVRLPFHRLMNPWSLGAVPHEIGHNLHADLNLWKITPGLIRARLADLGRSPTAQRTWSLWHKEIYADLIGVLLIGPYYVESLFDVVGKSPTRVARFRSGAVHPTSYLRPFISTALLRRIGFPTRADAYDEGWRRIYSPGVAARLPAHLRKGFRQTAAAIVDVLCFKPMDAYGGKALSQVVRFRPQDLITVREMAQRLASGTNPGIAPERFFIGAAREAMDQRLATPEQITRNFYTALTGR